jgi:hypothetical protein
MALHATFDPDKGVYKASIMYIRSYVRLLGYSNETTDSLARDSDNSENDTNSEGENSSENDMGYDSEI